MSNRWLLDNNLGKSLRKFLETQNIACTHAYDLGWAELTNGELVKAAYKAGLFQELECYK